MPGPNTRPLRSPSGSPPPGRRPPRPPRRPRGREGVTDLSGVVCHNDAGSQYTSIAFTERLAVAGAAPSVGTVGDALDNAPAATPPGLFKTDPTRPPAPR